MIILILRLQELFGAGDSDSYKGNESESDGEDWVPDPIDAKTGYFQIKVSKEKLSTSKDWKLIWDHMGKCIQKWTK